MNASRVSKLRIGLLIFAGILLAKLFYIQIIADRYKINASNNSMVYDIIYPTRGIIYDRNGKIIVGNKVAYDIQVTPKEVEPFDTVLLADVLDFAGLHPQQDVGVPEEQTENRLPVNGHAEADSVGHLHEVRRGPIQVQGIQGSDTKHPGLSGQCRRKPSGICL